MSQRSSSNVRIQTISKAEYNLIKHIPDANPFKKLSPETQCEIIRPTHLPFIQDASTESILKPSNRGEKESKSAASHTDSLEIQNLKAEIKRLTMELNNINEQNMYLSNEYEKQRIENNELSISKIDLERKLKAMEEENKNLKLEEDKKKYNEKENLFSQLEGAMNERNDLEIELNRYKSIQMKLENDLKEKANEILRIITEYEQKIDTLQGEYYYYKTQKEDEITQKNIELNQIQDENVLLSNEILNLRDITKKLQTLLDSQTQKTNESDESLKFKFIELNNNYKNVISQLETEQASNNDLRYQLKLNNDELKIKKDEYRLNVILLSAEIERLHEIISEKCREVELLNENIQLHAENEINKVKTEHSHEKMSIDNLSINMVNQNQELTQKINQMAEEYANLQKENSGLKSKLEEFTVNRNPISREKDIQQMSLKFSQERAMLETNIRNLKLKIVEFENRGVMFMIEIERLHGIIAEREKGFPKYNTQIMRGDTEFEKLNQMNNMLLLENEQLKVKLDTLRVQVEKEIKNTMEHEYILKLTQESINYENIINEIKTKNCENETNVFEIEKLKNIINDKDMQINIYKQQYEDGIKSIENLQTNLNEFHAKNDIEKKIMENSMNQLKTQIKEDNIKKVLLIAEIERLQYIIIELNQKIENSNYHRAEIEKTHAQLAKGHVERERNEIEKQLISNKDFSESQIKGLQARVIELEQILNVNRQEKDNLYTQISELNKSVEEFRIRFTNLQKEHANNLTRVQIEIQAKENQMKELASKFLNERQQFENQIRQLQSKIDELEYDRATLIGDNEALVQEIQNRRREDMESKNNIEKSNLKQRIIEYENKMASLKSEISALHQLNDEKNNQIEVWKTKYAQLEGIVNTQLESEKRNNVDGLMKQFTKKFNEDKTNIDNQANKNKELSEKVNNLTLEIEKLKALIDSISKENDSLKQMHSQLEIQRTTDLENLRLNMENEKKQLIEREVKAHAAKASVQKNENELKVKELKQKNIELDQRNQYLSNELNRVSQMLDERLKEIENWQKKFVDFERQKQNEIEALVTQAETLRRNTVGTDEYKIRFLAEKTSYDTQISQLKQKISEYELRINELIKENLKLNQLYSEKQNELERVHKEHISKMDEYAYNMENLRNQLNQHISNNSDSKDIEIKDNIEKKKLMNEILNLKQALEASHLKNNQYIEILNQKKSENDILIKQINDSKNEVQKLTNELKNMENNYLVNTNKYNQLFQEAQEIAKSRDKYKALFDINNFEFTQKNNELLEKIRQVDLLKKKYDDALANMAAQISTRSKVSSKSPLADRK